ncbi:hypothetical protein Q428_01445 [Fervidicella metallireducens AeB]|uniref:Stage III sporulation protein AB n=1 Tax=Fervidicella metallireducens AeB TaxID=1403537 RepID=A0A017S0N0_9CLOT|nr:stage III sporulation protein SpoIIIAB [Fervidicella metallireducens]EYE89740.1 hypothetical protein Q428_01445 [Fervidicella metallireducens AeB]
MLKLIGSLIVITATTILGFSYARVYSERVNQLRAMQYALNILETEIVYSATPLMEALIYVSEKTENNISMLFSMMADILNQKSVTDVVEAFYLAFNKLKNELYLEKEEVEVIAAFMQSVGSSDLEGQKKNFNITIKKMEAFEKRAEETRSKNEKLYKYLGVCSGAILIILLV